MATRTNNTQAATAEFLAELMAHVSATLMDGGIAEKTADEYALKVVTNVRQAVGGGAIYLPKGTALDVALSHSKLFQDYCNGISVPALAKKYEFSQQHVYRTIKTINNAKRQADKLDQADMFGYDG